MSTCSTCPADETDLKWWLDLSLVLGWRTAPGSPLSSVTRGKQLPEKAFDRAVRVIQTFGERLEFEGVSSFHLNRGEVHWWVMADDSGVQLINRRIGEKAA